MKGIILAGGKGTRLAPLTQVTSKQLLPVYDKPMVYYPIETLLRAGIKDILIIVAPDNAGDFLKLLGSGSSFGAKFTYEIQDRPEGIAQAFLLGETFIGSDDVALILGDNLFDYTFENEVRAFKGGAHIFAKEVKDPERFGVVAFGKDKIPEKIVEKPKEFISNLAITGFYIFDNKVIKSAKSCQPSARGELEIVDVINQYLSAKELEVSVIDGEWLDAGTFDSLLDAAVWARSKQGVK
jgi:glucose-1-phosphate thymidylyltransferase